MNTLLAFIVVIALAALIAGWIKPSLVRMPSKKRSSIVYGAVLVVALILFSATQPPTPPATETQAPAAVAQTATDTNAAVASATAAPVQSTKPTATVAPAPTPVAPAQSAPVTTPAKAATPAPSVVLLSVSGSGQKSTQTFTAPSNWTLDYTYDCSDFGSRGNFQVYITDADGSDSFLDGPNELGMSGSDTEYYHQGGQFYLEVNSECSWTITAKS